jgi:hypothetical protein
MMIRLFSIVLAFLAASHAVRADFLIGYDLNHAPLPNHQFNPSVAMPGLFGDPISAKGLQPTLFSGGGADGSQFLCLDGWDSTNQFSFARTDLDAADHTFSFDISFDGSFSGEISGLSFDWNRFAGNAPQQLQASLFWQDSGGSIQYRASEVLDLAGVGTWSTSTLDFDAFGSLAIPSGTALGGSAFHVELYGFGGSGGPLFLDNVTLHGSISPVPEPGGSLLLLSSGLLWLVFRRRIPMA